MNIRDSAKEKIQNGRISELTYEEWEAWSLFGKDRPTCKKYIATVVLDNCEKVRADIYHNEINAAAGTAKALFQIGLPEAPADSISEIRVSDENEDEKIYLSKDGKTVHEDVVNP